MSLHIAKGLLGAKSPPTENHCSAWIGYNSLHLLSFPYLLPFLLAFFPRWEKIVIYLLLMQKMRASLVAQLVKNPPAMQRPGFDPWLGKIPQRRERLPTPVFWLGEFHGLYSPQGHNELDITEQL